VPEVALKEGGVLLADEQPTFAMRWRNIQEFWQVPFDVCRAMILIMLYMAYWLSSVVHVLKQ
jgi:hypothetical protein